MLDQNASFKEVAHLFNQQYQLLQLGRSNPFLSLPELQYISISYLLTYLPIMNPPFIQFSCSEWAHMVPSKEFTLIYKYVVVE